jgi:hypothetical protein
MSSPSIFRERAVWRARQEPFLWEKRLATANQTAKRRSDCPVDEMQDKFFVFTCPSTNARRIAGLVDVATPGHIFAEALRRYGNRVVTKKRFVLVLCLFQLGLVTRR